jgi:excisionase family DNA binding protein
MNTDLRRPTPPVTTPDALTSAELASMLRLHPVTVRLKAAAGEIPGIRIGNRWRFSRARIEEWLRQTGRNN